MAEFYWEPLKRQVELRSWERGKKRGKTFLPSFRALSPSSQAKRTNVAPAGRSMNGQE